MKIIRYLPKITQARTEYRDCREEDHQWLITACTRWLVRMAQLDQASTEDQKIVRDHWWHRRTKTLPRGQLGLNTPCSFIAGCVWNMLWQQPPQRDFTQHQMEGIEIISTVISELFPEEEQVRFQIGFTEG